MSSCGILTRGHLLSNTYLGDMREGAMYNREGLVFGIKKINMVIY